MKKLFYLLLCAIFTFGFGSTPDNLETPTNSLSTFKNNSSCQKAIIQVAGMTCSMCAQGIQKRLNQDIVNQGIETDFENKCENCMLFYFND